MKVDAYFIIEEFEGLLGFFSEEVTPDAKVTFISDGPEAVVSNIDGFPFKDDITVVEPNQTVTAVVRGDATDGKHDFEITIGQTKLVIPFAVNKFGDVKAYFVIDPSGELVIGQFVPNTVKPPILIGFNTRPKNVPVEVKVAGNNRIHERLVKLPVKDPFQTLALTPIARNDRYRLTLQLDPSLLLQIGGTEQGEIIIEPPSDPGREREQRADRPHR